MTPCMTYFADKLRELREAAGWTQEELAHRLGVRRQAIIKWESGEQSPRMDRLNKIADVFGVPVGELLQPSK